MWSSLKHIPHYQQKMGCRKRSMPAHVLKKLVWVSVLVLSVCTLVLSLLAVVIAWRVATHPLEAALAATQWNCLYCVCCCHCWPTSWTLISSASSATPGWTAASWAALWSAARSLSCSGLSRSLHPRWCWHRKCKCTCVWAPGMPGWIPLPLLSAAVPVPLWGRPFWSLTTSPSASSKGTGWDSEWGWAAGKHGEGRISFFNPV